MYTKTDNRVATSTRSFKKWPFKNSCSEIKVSSKVYSKVSKFCRVSINLQPRLKLELDCLQKRTYRTII